MIIDVWYSEMTKKWQATFKSFGKENIDDLWNMVGGGGTKQEAIDDLMSQLKCYRAYEKTKNVRNGVKYAYVCE